MPNADEAVLALVCRALAMTDPRLECRQISPEASLVDDLGLDSLKFIDLSMTLEELLGRGELPMEEWIAEEDVKTTGGFTVAALCAFCAKQIDST